MRNFLHAGLDFSGAWKEKGWECSREPGQIGQKQHYGFLLGGESSPLRPPNSHQLTMGLLGCKQQEPCEKGQGASKARERGFNLLACAMLGHWPSHC